MIWSFIKLVLMLTGCVVWIGVCVVALGVALIWASGLPRDKWFDNQRNL